MYILAILFSIFVSGSSYSASTEETIISNVTVVEHISVTVSVVAQMLLPTFDAGAPPASWVRSSYSGSTGAGHNAVIELVGPAPGVCFCRTHSNIPSYTNGTTTYYLYVDDITNNGRVGAGITTCIYMPNNPGGGGGGSYNGTYNYMDFILEGYFSNPSGNATVGTYVGTGTFTLSFDGTGC